MHIINFTFYSGHEKIVELLIQYGASIEAINKRDETPLHRATVYGNLNIQNNHVQKVNQINDFVQVTTRLSKF